MSPHEAPLSQNLAPTDSSSSKHSRQSGGPIGRSTNQACCVAQLLGSGFCLNRNKGSHPYPPVSVKKEARHPNSTPSWGCFQPSSVVYVKRRNATNTSAVLSLFRGQESILALPRAVRRVVGHTRLHHRELTRSMEKRGTPRARGVQNVGTRRWGEREGRRAGRGQLAHPEPRTKAIEACLRLASREVPRERAVPKSLPGTSTDILAEVEKQQMNERSRNETPSVPSRTW